MRGGYPEPVLANDGKYFQAWMQNYFQFYIERDIRKLFPKLDSLTYRRFVSTLSEVSGTIINKAQLASLKKFLQDNALPLGIVINNSAEVKTLASNIVQVPAGII